MSWLAAFGCLPADQSLSRPLSQNGRNQSVDISFLSRFGFSLVQDVPSLNLKITGLAPMRVVHIVRPLRRVTADTTHSLTALRAVNARFTVYSQPYKNVQKRANQVLDRNGSFGSVPAIESTAKAAARAAGIGGKAEVAIGKH
jgi:hypothetical protein